MKKIYICIFILLNFVFFSNASIPLIVDSQEIVFRKISKSINIELPPKVDILICDFMILNAPKEIGDKINKNFEIIMKSQQFVYKYSILFMKDEIAKNPTSDYSFVENYNELELIAYAKYIQKDAILIASVTIIEGENKKVWNSKSGEYAEKKIALLQGNIFNTETSESMLRFSYYFLTD